MKTTDGPGDCKTYSGVAMDRDHNGRAVPGFHGVPFLFDGFRKPLVESRAWNPWWIMAQEWLDTGLSWRYVWLELVDLRGPWM